MSKKRSDRSPYPAQGSNIDSKVGGDMPEGHPMKYIGVYF